MSHDQRTGLISWPSGDGTTPSWRDARQWILAAAAARRVVGTLLGGPGIHDGGALTQASLTTGGTVYPACLAIVPDVAGELWYAKLPATAINMLVTATAAGEARLYLVPSLAANTSPAMAAGAAADFAFVADDVANTPPTHGVLLGSGTLTGSAFTAYSAATTIPPTSKVKPAHHAPTHQHGGADEIATATPAANAVPKADSGGKLDTWVTDASTSAKGKVQLAADGGTTAGTAVQANDARLNADRVVGPASSVSGNLVSFNGAGGKTLQDSGKAAASVVTGPASAVNTDLAILDATGKVISDSGVLLADVARLGTAQAFTARCTFTNGLRAQVRDAKFGFPASGTYVAGDWWVDRAGAWWYCTAPGTPGTWEQVTVGIADTWSGAGTADITKAGSGGNWAGDPTTPINGYRVLEPAYGGIWTYNTGLSSARWVGRQYAISVPPVATAYSANNTGGYVHLSDDYDYQLVEYSAMWSGAAGTWDAGNKWQIQLRKGSVTLGALANWSDLVEIAAAGTNGGRAAPASGAAIHVTATHGILYFGVVKTGTTPGNLTVFGGSALVRELRK